jgi:proteasome lid subunit RPN8/RPN11
VSEERPVEILRLAAGLRDELAAQARRAAPRECCGLLVGTPDRIDALVASPNLDPDPARYRIDPALHIRTNRELRATGRAVVGVYHSHPRGPAGPSPADIEEAMYPDFVHLIISAVDRKSPEIRAYRIIRRIVWPIGLEEESAGHPS